MPATIRKKGIVSKILENILGKPKNYEEKSKRKKK
jgi:hypothetical protein